MEHGWMDGWNLILKTLKHVVCQILNSTTKEKGMTPPQKRRLAGLPWCFPVSPFLPWLNDNWCRWVAFALCHVDVHDVVVTALYSSHSALVKDQSVLQGKVTEGRVGAG